MIADANGMLCRRLDSWLLSLGGARKAELGPARCKALRAAIRRPSRLLRLTIAAVVTVGLVWLGTNWLSADNFDPAQLVGVRVLWVCGFGVLALVLYATLSGELGVTTARVVGVCTEAGICASCGAAIRESDDEDWFVCPACGASWHSEPEDGGKTEGSP